MELDMEEINERMDKTTGKLDVLGGNHDLVKKKLSRMASIIEGFFYRRNLHLNIAAVSALDWRDKKFHWSRFML